MAEQKVLNQNKHEPTADSQIDTNKILAALAYLGLLVLVPLFVNQEKKDEFINYHTKQGLVLAGVGILLFAIRWIVPGGGFFYTGFGFGYLLWAFVGLIITLVQLGLLALVIIGILHVIQDEKKPLPIIGKFAKSIKI